MQVAIAKNHAIVLIVRCLGGETFTELAGLLVVLIGLGQAKRPQQRFRSRLTPVQPHR